MIRKWMLLVQKNAVLVVGARFAVADDYVAPAQVLEGILCNY